MPRNTRIYVAALALFAAGLGFLVYTGLSEGSSYHLEVAEALSMPERDLQNVRVFGAVSPDGIDRAADSLGVRFFLQDRHDARTVMAVVYKGAVPDTFKPGTELYAEGGYAANAGIFRAEGLITTCPSKYTKENRR
jgi:cytochrome c-type biogenesis protein CcmE